MRHPFLSQQIEQRSFPKGARHNFYIYGPVSDDINEYVDMITIMDIAEECDEVHLFINTPGGSLDTTISIIHAMARCKAHIVTHADGQVASAGTLLFLAGSNYVVYPYAHCMFHDGSAGSIGKINENLKNMISTTNLIRRLCYDIYFPFFSHEEIDEILEGKDYYCDADEMVERINKGAEIIEELQNQEEETEDSEEEDNLFRKVMVDNKALKTHGMTGLIIDDTQENLKKVEFEDGSKHVIHKRNLIYVD